MSRCFARFQQQIFLVPFQPRTYFEYIDSFLTACIAHPSLAVARQLQT